MLKKLFAVGLAATMVIGTGITALATSYQGTAGTAEFTAAIELSNKKAHAYIDADSDCYLSIDGYAVTSYMKYYLVASADNSTYVESTRTTGDEFRSAQVRFVVAASDDSGSRTFDLLEDNYSD